MTTPTIAPPAELFYTHEDFERECGLSPSRVRNRYTSGMLKARLAPEGVYISKDELEILKTTLAAEKNFHFEGIKDYTESQWAGVSSFPFERAVKRIQSGLLRGAVLPDGRIRVADRDLESVSGEAFRQVGGEGARCDDGSAWRPKAPETKPFKPRIRRFTWIASEDDGITQTAVKNLAASGVVHPTKIDSGGFCATENDYRRVREYVQTPEE